MIGEIGGAPYGGSGVSAARRTSRREALRRVGDGDDGVDVGVVVYGGETTGNAPTGGGRRDRGVEGDDRYAGGDGGGDDDGGGGGGRGGGGGGSNIVEIVADFQGRLRRQMRAALADTRGSGSGIGGSSGGMDAEWSSYTRGTIGVVNAAQPRPRQQTGERRGSLSKAGHNRDGVFSSRGESCNDILGDLEKRVGSV